MKWVLLGWVVVAGAFILRMTPSALTHDFVWHTYYAQTIAHEHRLPRPDETPETYQPPLYYLLNSLLPSEMPRHVLWVKLMSMVYGLLALLILGRALALEGFSKECVTLVLGVLATTPAFLFIFSTYNNDSLETLLNFACLLGATELLRRWTPWKAVAWVLIVAASLYTKLSGAFLLTGLTVLTTIGFWNHSESWPSRKRLFLLAALGALCLAPWVIRNYRLTGMMTPGPAKFPFFKEIYLQRGAWRTILTPPGWSAGEWKDPFAHDWDLVNSKRNSYLACLFSTSIFDEYSLRALPMAWLWTLTGIHALLAVAALGFGIAWKKGRAYLALILVGIFGYSVLLFRFPYSTMMNFRYVAWVWYPLSFLRARAMTEGQIAAGLRIAACIGILLQLLFIGGLMLGTGQWYWL